SQKRAAVVAPTEKTAVASGADSKVGRAVPSAPPPSAVVNDGALRSTRPTKTRSSGTPAIADREPGTQDEKDWIDNRWSRTEVGDTTVRESPKAEPVGGSTAFIRTIEIGPHGSPLEFRFASALNNPSIHEEEDDLSGRAAPVHRLRCSSTNATGLAVTFLQGAIGKDLKVRSDKSASV